MASPRHDWYLAHWLKHLRKKQADVVRDLDWNKAKVSLTAAGKQPYTRDDVNEVADYLHLKPYELLMHPADAMAIRQLRASAQQIVSPVPDPDPDPDPVNTTSFFDEQRRRETSSDSKRKTGTRD